MLLGAEGLEPMGKRGLRIEAGEEALRRVKNHIYMLAIGLALHQADGHIQIKMLLPDMVQLMLQNLLPAGRGQERIDIDVEAAVIIGDADPLHRTGQVHQAKVIINHCGAGPQ